MGRSTAGRIVEHVRMAEKQREYEKEMKQQHLNEARLRQQQRLQISLSGNVQQPRSSPMQGKSPVQPPSTPSPTAKFKAGSNAYLDSISASPDPSGSEPTLNSSPLDTGAIPLPIDTKNRASKYIMHPVPSPFRSV